MFLNKYLSWKEPSRLCSSGIYLCAPSWHGMLKCSYTVKESAFCINMKGRFSTNTHSLLKAHQVWILLEDFENISIYQRSYRFWILCHKHTVLLYTENMSSQLIEITVLSLLVLLSLFQQAVKEGDWQGSKLLDTIAAPGAWRCETMMISLPIGINLDSLAVTPHHDKFLCWQKWKFGEIFIGMLIIFKINSLRNRALTHAAWHAL